MNYSLTRQTRQRLDLTAPTRLLGPRKLLREGKVEKAKSGRNLNLYLFNDLLVFTESKPGGTTEVVYRLVSLARWFSPQSIDESVDSLANSSGGIFDTRASPRRSLLRRELSRRIGQCTSRQCSTRALLDEGYRIGEKDLSRRGQQLAKAQSKF